LHALNDRKGQHAIAINDQWRICFRFSDGDAFDVEVCDYHEWPEGEMSIPNTRAMMRRPIHPGEMLREDFLPDYGLTVASLAEAAGVSRQSVNELLRGRRAQSPEMALRLSRLFGNSPEFWLDAQRAVDLWDAAQRLQGKVRRIKPLRVA
jgi:addiction module HigA family antidote